jgi:aminocarboxymuconate-semialdehyde decarboxylase
MDEQGIDVEAISINPSWYRLERDKAAEVIRINNETLAELCAAHPDRFVGFASLSLQFPDLAVEQLEHAIKKLGMRGAAIGGSVAGEEFSDAKYSSSVGQSRGTWHPDFHSTRKARQN